jgi:hypothetical protein
MTKVVSIIMLSICLLYAFVISAAAQPRMVGVDVSDWFKYVAAVDWSSNDPNATFPPPDWEMLEEMNETEWMLCTFESISGTNITLQFTSHFKNGTEIIENGYIDVDTGDGNMTYVVISSNLDVNDTVYTSLEYSTQKINETVIRSYPGVVRETNHMNQTMTGIFNETSLYYNKNIYWDRPTGMCVEESYEMRNQTGEYLTTWSMSFRIADSNVWIIPEFPSFLILPLFMIATLLAVIVYRRKHSV